MLKESYLKSAQLEIKNHMDISLTLDEIEKILLNDDEEFHYEECNYVDYNGPWDGFGLDTLPREIVLDTVSKHLFGVPVPCYGDSEEVKAEFLNKLKDYNTK